MIKNIVIISIVTIFNDKKFISECFKIINFMTCVVQIIMNVIMLIYQVNGC